MDKNVIKWIEKNHEAWEIICGVKEVADPEQLQGIFDCLCLKAREEEGFDVMLLSLLTKHSSRLFPGEASSQGDFAMDKYLSLMKEQSLR